MKKTISILLVLLMLFFIPAVSYAADAEAGPLSYLLLGDSIAYGSGVLNSRQACYGKIVADTNGYDYANYSVPGHRTADLLHRLSVDSVAAAVEEADIISISIGGNDYLTNNIAGLVADFKKGDISRYEEIDAVMKANFAEIMTVIREANPDAVVLLQTLYNPLYGTETGEAYAEAIKRINATFYDYLEEGAVNCYVVDVAGAMDGKEGLIAGDSIHPSAEGNRVIARVMLQELYDLGLGENTEPVYTARAIEIPQTMLVRFFARLRAFFQKLFSFFK